MSNAPNNTLILHFSDTLTIVIQKASENNPYFIENRKFIYDLRNFSITFNGFMATVFVNIFRKLPS